MERLAFQMQAMEAKMTAIEGALGKFNADGGELEGMLVRMREAVSGGLDAIQGRLAGAERRLAQAENVVPRVIHAEGLIQGLAQGADAQSQRTSALEQRMNDAEGTTRSHDDRLKVQEDNAARVLTDGKRLLKQVMELEKRAE